MQAFKREIQEELGYDAQESEVVTVVKALIPDSPNYRYIIRTIMDASQFKTTPEVAQFDLFDLTDLPPTKYQHHIASAVELSS